MACNLFHFSVGGWTQSFVYGGQVLWNWASPKPHFISRTNIRLQVENSYDLCITPCWQVDYVKIILPSALKEVLSRIPVAVI